MAGKAGARMGPAGTIQERILPYLEASVILKWILPGVYYVVGTPTATQVAAQICESAVVWPTAQIS